MVQLSTFRKRWLLAFLLAIEASVRTTLCGAFVPNLSFHAGNTALHSQTKMEERSSTPKNTTVTNSDATASLPGDTASALALQQQAEQLRAEALALEKQLEAEREAKTAKQIANVDQWLNQLLVNQTIDENMEILNSVEQVTQLLKDGRYSAEQVNRMFDRICDTLGYQSRSRCSPLMELLVDAAGKLDEVERYDNPNKRWSGKVERHLRKRLFAMDFGMDLEHTDPPE